MELLGQMTQRGNELRRAALAGESALQFTRCAAGSGETAADAAVLDSEQQALTMGQTRSTDTGHILPVTLVAALAQQDYLLTEVGLYARDGAGETLYWVYRMTSALAITAGGGLTVRFELEEAIDGEPEVTVSPAGLVTERDLTALMGAPDGLATLDGNGKAPDAQLPAHAARHASGGSDCITPTSIGAAVASHTQAASTISEGTFAGKVRSDPTARAVLTDYQLRDIAAGSTDMTAGSTALSNGLVYLVYE